MSPIAIYSVPCQVSFIFWNQMASQLIFLFLLVGQVVAMGAHAETFEPCHKKQVNLDAYNQSEICSDIDLVNPNSTEMYFHCRVVRGYISIRHLDLMANPDKLSFPNLEVITDFLLLYHINSSKGSRSLNFLFPKLRAIHGRHRFINTSLYISHFYAADQVEMNSLIDICGPVWVSYSPNLCFRHSPFYWQIQPKVNDTSTFVNASNITMKNLLVSSLEEDHFDARLKIFFDLNDDQRHLWKEFKYVRLSIYHVDVAQYNYMVHRLPGPSNCTETVLKDNAFYLDDLVDSDNVNVFLRDHLKESIDRPEPLGQLPHTTDGITLPSNRHLDKAWNYLWANYDIRHLSHIRIDQTNSLFGVVEMPEVYPFEFDNLYMIKLSTCFGEFMNNCSISRVYRFMPTRDTLFLGAPFAQTKSNLSQLLKSSNLITAGLIVAALFSIVILLVILTRFKLIMKKIHRSRLLSYRPVNVVSANPEYAGFNSIWSWDPAFQSNLFDDISCEISRSKVIILHQRLLGKGEFGYVHEGILFDDNNNCDCNGNHQHVRSNGHNSLRVAIKQLRDNAKQIDKEKFMVEAKYMKTFNSNFLVKLIGVVTVQEPILVVMEYMENGDLKCYLRKKHHEFKEKNIFSLVPNLDSTVRMAIQIADGMHYLHSKKVIHRDLAARNCMVTHDLTVKIGDFGLTRHVYEKDYYRLSEQTPMPLRWMAPESVRKMIFTAQTDVWSYGVVLWEIMMFGQQPYKGTSDQDVKKLLVDCVHLPQPTFPNHVIWELAKKCWSKRPLNRPTFGEIIEELYPHLDKQKAEFDNMSYYQSCRAQYRDPFSCSLTRLISHHCFDFFSKFTSGQSLSSLSNSQSNGYSNRSLHSGCQCLPSNGCKRHNSYHLDHHRRSSRSTTGSNRPRCQSFDSLQSGSACSEITAITSISSVSSQEASIDSRHNSTGSEQIPLI